jgi:hypothetical protein
MSLELIQSRAGGKAVSFGGNQIYLMGGYNETNPVLSSVEIFEIREEGDTIKNGPELMFARKEFMAVNFNNSIYVFGGQDVEGQPVTQIEKLDLVVDVEDKNVTQANYFELNNNYPNPFNPSTIISYRIPKTSFVSLKIHDVLGKEVAIIVNEVQGTGFYQYIFNPSDYGNSSVEGGLSSGIYFYKIQVSEFFDYDPVAYTETK